MSEEVYGPIITTATTVLFGWLLIRGFRTGTMDFSTPALPMHGRRKDQPVRFWLVAAWLGFLVFASAFATVGQLFFPNGM